VHGDGNGNRGSTGTRLSLEILPNLLARASGKLFRIGQAMRDVGIGGLTLGSGVAGAQAHFCKTIMAKEKKPTEQERFAQTHPKGVFHP
jgi:hypothetical protein